MQTLKKLSSSLSVAATLYAISATNLFAQVAQAQQTVPWDKPGSVCVSNGVATIQGFQCLIGNLLSVAMSGLGLIGFIMFIVGAFRYLLSGGNAKGTEGGKNTITFAVIGIVVALSAFIILQLVAEFTGVRSILQFTIPSSDTTF